MSIASRYRAPTPRASTECLCPIETVEQYLITPNEQRPLVCFVTEGSYTRSSATVRKCRFRSRILSGRNPDMLRRAFFWLVPALCCVSQLSAGIIYSNIGAGFPGDTGAYGFGGPSVEGTAFTATGQGNLWTIFVGIDGDSLPATVGLYSDSSGQSGTLLESWTFIVPSSLPTLTSVLHPLLSSGTEYWFVMEIPNRGQNEGWRMNDEGVTGGVWYGPGRNTWSQIFPDEATLGIQLTSVSEPTSAVLFVIGSFVLVPLSRRLKTA